MKDELLRAEHAGEADAINQVPTPSGAKALLARISSTGPEGFSPSKSRDQLQLVRCDGPLNLSTIIIASVDRGHTPLRANK